MEIDEKTLKGFWSKDDKSSTQLFIINEAIISKFCILGEDIEPCFEGSSITKIQFSFEDNFKEQLNSMIQQVIEYEGGARSMFKQYAAEIGEALWCSIHAYLLNKYPGEDEWSSSYQIEGIYEEGAQKFTILKDRKTGAYQRLNFTINDSNEVSFNDDLLNVTKTFVPAATPQFALEDIEAFEREYAKKKKEEQQNEEEEEEIYESEISIPELSEISSYISSYIETLDSERVNLATLGNVLKKRFSGFDARNYKFSNMTQMMRKIDGFRVESENAPDGVHKVVYISLDEKK